MTMSSLADRPDPGAAPRTLLIRAAFRLEWFTVAWMVVEAAVALTSGVRARSISLTAFGVDSLIELASAGVLIWRLNVELRRGQSVAETAERAASRIGGALLLGLAAYIVVGAGWRLWTRQGAEFSWPGLLVSLAAIAIMWLLSRRKPRKLELTETEPNCWYHYQFYYYGRSPDDPNKELITTIGVKSIVTQPNDDTETLSPGIHMIRGYAWSGAGAIDRVDVSVDGGETWHSANIEQPRDRFMWVRWSYRWDAGRKGKYMLMSRATDEVGRVQSHQPRYNYMRKNFSAIVGYPVAVA